MQVEYERTSTLHGKRNNIFWCCIVASGGSACDLFVSDQCHLCLFGIWDCCVGAGRGDGVSGCGGG